MTCQSLVTFRVPECVALIQRSFLAFEDNFHGFFPIKNTVTLYGIAQVHNGSFHKSQKVFLLLEQGESFWKY